MCNRVRSSCGSKFVLYCEINNELAMHNVYSRHAKPGVYIPEHYRTAFTRMRLSAHRFRVETGRWARIPRERRLCPCGTGVQDERHVFTCCSITEHLRYDGTVPHAFPDVIASPKTVDDFRYIYDIFECFT